MIAASNPAQTYPIAIEIGGMAITLTTSEAGFRELLASRYAGFVKPSLKTQFEIDIDLCEPYDPAESDEDVRVTRQATQWLIQRGDFQAQWNPASGRGRVRQTANPYAIDSVLRIVHTLILARQGGFLVHAASAIRGGCAFLFAGVSGAGKTTISRLAPPDTKLLTDEISYVRLQGDGYWAYGTPFAGELARVGENESAPVRTLFLLEKGRENRIEELTTTDAVRSLMRNILFFAEDRNLVAEVFHAACEFANRVPVRRLIFVPDERVWEIIR